MTIRASFISLTLVMVLAQQRVSQINTSSFTLSDEL